jgi:hypothetical protein
MSNKIEEMIAEERLQIEGALKDALAERDAASMRVKRLRAKLDAAPRLHVRRSRKAKGADVIAQLGMVGVDEEGDAL